MARTKRSILLARRRAAAMRAIRQADGHSRERRAKPVEDPRKVVMDARKRMIRSPKGDILHPIYSHPCGRVIEATARDWDEAIALWAVFDSLDRADDARARHVVGRSRFPTCTKLEYLTERFEARPDDRPDTRTEDEKARDASNAWARWSALLARLPRYHRGAIIAAMRGLCDVARDNLVTLDGVLFVKAMRGLRDECERG